MSKKKLKGGSLPTQEQRITIAMNGNYTPLINAIIRIDIDRVRTLLENHADPNERDSQYNWCPLKWATFVFIYGDDDDYDIVDIQGLLRRAGGLNCYDDYNLREDSYNFSPVITEIDEQLEQIRRDAEEYEEDNIQNTRNTMGGTRRRKHKKSRKHKKPHKKNKRTSTKKRKPRKK